MSLTNFSRGQFVPKNPEKYIGRGSIMYRSSWELTVMNMLDMNPGIQKWASESIRIPYIDPFTGNKTSYVPDFFVNYVDKHKKQHAELWEIKPANQTLLEKVGRSKRNQIEYVRNMAKWEAAREFCKQKHIIFRVINESDIYAGTKK